MFTSEGNTNAKGNTIPGLWEKLIKYKYLAPTQKRLPNALVEGVGVRGGGGGFGQFREIYLVICYNDICQHM